MAAPGGARKRLYCVPAWLALAAGNRQPRSARRRSVARTVNVYLVQNGQAGRVQSWRAAGARAMGKQGRSNGRGPCLLPDWLTKF